MPNMSYCRFQNTVGDLEDCYDHIDLNENDLSQDEEDARKRLIKICVDIALEYGDQIDREVIESD